MKDPISRQDAIKEIARWIGYIDEDMILRIQTGLKKLPPKEPETIRCKDCKWCEDADGLMCKNPAPWVVATEDDFGCVCAKRREVKE